MSPPLRIGFFGTPELASRILGELVEDGRFEIAFVVTNIDKPFGRHGELRQSPVKATAITHRIPVLQPEKIRGNDQFLNHIRSFWCDYFVVVAYGKILPTELLSIPRKMCINVHGSLLPRYRWASPIQSALLHGETETGVTIMQMSEGMDEGDMILSKHISIESDETSATLFEKFGEVSGWVLIDAILGLEAGSLTLIPQDSTNATYCTKISKEDGYIDWNQSAQTIYQMWQAYTPWPGISTLYRWKRLLLEKISISHSWALPSKHHAIGRVIVLDDGEIGVVCGGGIIALQQVKLEGKKSQSLRDFLNGNQDFLSATLGDDRSWEYIQ